MSFRGVIYLYRLEAHFIREGDCRWGFGGWWWINGCSLGFII
jgi:hypothetical protein